MRRTAPSMFAWSGPRPARQLRAGRGTARRAPVADAGAGRGLLARWALDGDQWPGAVAHERRADLAGPDGAAARQGGLDLSRRHGRLLTRRDAGGGVERLARDGRTVDDAD